MIKAGFREYIKALLRTAEYVRDAQCGCVVAHVPLLPGCLTQAETFEDARDSLIDAMELWILNGLMQGEVMPEVGGVCLGACACELEECEAGDG